MADKPKNREAGFQGWFDEMMDCQNMDSENHFRYNNTAWEATAEQQIRMQTFLIRHHWLDQFLAEDAQGKR